MPDLAHLAADREDGLGSYREGELARAMAALGVTDHRFLGAQEHGRPARVYRDSGMAYAADGAVIPVPDPHPDAFALAGVDEPAERVADVLREVRPQVVVTYEPGGGDGHPDHIQAHRVAMRAVELAAVASGAGGAAWRVPKVYWGALPERMVRATLHELTAAGRNPFAGWDPGGVLPSMMITDELVTTCVDGTDYAAHKTRALRAHATQVAVDGPFFALSNGIGQPMLTREYFRLVGAEPAGPRDADGRETGLFAGL